MFLLSLLCREIVSRANSGEMGGDHIIVDRGRGWRLCRCSRDGMVEIYTEYIL